MRAGNPEKLKSSKFLQQNNRKHLFSGENWNEHITISIAEK